MTRRLANGLGGFGGLILLAQLDSKRCCTSRKGCLDARNVRFERGVIGRWLDVASWARISVGRRVSGKMFDLLEQGLQWVRVGNVFHHLVLACTPSDVSTALMTFSAACSQW